MQNIVIFFMSTFPPEKSLKPTATGRILFRHFRRIPSQLPSKRKNKPSSYCDQTGAFSADCIHTNETALKYFDWKLKLQNEKIDHVLAIVTDKAKKQLPKFETLFPNKDFPITPVELSGEINMDQSFHTVSNLFSETTKLIKDPANTTIHIDFTGGLRHTAMLLLALMQMFKFAGIRTGLVTYTNFQSKKIEDATPLVNIFTLISGTNEFKSFGVANHIQEYFGSITDKSPNLTNLLDAIQVFSDKIKVCSSVEDMNGTINELKVKLNEYSNHLLLKNPVESQEELFSKLVPLIKEDFRELITRSNTPTYELGLIRWCMRKELLQQAATLYTQWIPKFMIQNKLVTLHDEDVKKECDSSGQAWKSWEIGLFLNYTPNTLLLQVIKNNDFSIDNLCTLLKQPITVQEVLEYIPKDEIRIRLYFQLVTTLNNCDKSKWLTYLTALHKDHLFHHVIDEKRNCPKETYLKTRIKHSQTIQEFLFKEFANINSSAIDEFIMNPKNKTHITSKVERDAAFQQMLKDKTITTTIPEQELLNLIKNYAIIADIRNSINHANAKEIAEFKETAQQDLKTLAKYVK